MSVETGGSTAQRRDEHRWWRRWSYAMGAGLEPSGVALDRWRGNECRRINGMPDTLNGDLPTGHSTSASRRRRLPHIGFGQIGCPDGQLLSRISALLLGGIGVAE